MLNISTIAILMHLEYDHNFLEYLILEYLHFHLFQSKQCRFILTFVFTITTILFQVGFPMYWYMRPTVSFLGLNILAVYF